MSRKKSRKGKSKCREDDGKDFRSRVKKKSIKRSSRHWRKRMIDEVRDGILDTDDFETFE
ncbi:MAG: hypothetical protein H8D80_00610 [Proteobacteria bacterium]|nr:hypothetical protein [Pseudomonadota bacterium]